MMIDIFKKRVFRTLMGAVLLISVFAKSAEAQQTISLSFSVGFLGTQGNNSNSTTDNKTFATLGISKASFSQVDTNGDGKFGDGGTQGNDLAGVIKFYFTNGNVITLNGALNFRNNGNSRDIFGFIFASGQNTSFTYGANLTYNIITGTTASTSTSLGLRAYASTEVITSTFGGNASTSGLLDELNLELANTPQPSTIALTNASVTEGQNLVYTVTLTRATAANNPQVYTFSSSGTATGSSDYNATYTFSNGVVNNGDGTITVPGGVSSFTITAATIDDATIESTETLILNIGSKSATGNILDNDAVPTLTTTGTLKTFSVCSSYQNASQSISVSGVYLTNNIVLTAPVGYEISTSASSGYTSTITLNQSSGTVSSTDIYVRTLTSNTTSGTSTLTITSTGAVNKNTTLTANSDNALAMDGASDFVSLPTNVINGFTNFTFESWVYPTSSSSWQRIFDFGKSSSTGYIFLTNSFNNNNLPRFAITTGTNTGEQTLSSNTVMPLNTWSHIAIVLNATAQTATMYLNGSQVATGSITLNPSSLGTITAAYLGKSFWPDPFLAGRIDEVRIWNTVRTGTDISNNYQKELSGNESGLVAYYNFNQGTPNGSNTGLTSLNDKTANNYNGTLNTFDLSGTSSNFIAGSIPAINATGNATSLSAGGTLQLTNTLTGGTWSTSNASLATIDATTGLVTGVAAGSVVMTYTVCGKVATYNLTVTSPTITITGTLKTFISCSGATITPQSFTIAGTNLGANVTVTAPTGFEISTTSGGTYSSTLSLTPSSGTLASSDVFVRLINSSTTASSGVISVTSTGAVSRTVTATVNTDNALNFDGTNDAINIGQPISTGSSYTMEAWINYKPPVGNNTASNIISSNQNPFFISTDNKLYAGVAGAYSVVTSPTVIPQNIWTHIAVSFDNATKTMLLYINGAQVATGVAASGFTLSGAEPIYIGSHTGAGSSFSPVSFFKGNIDEVRIWNIVKSANDIQANMFKELVGSESNLKSYYNFNQGVIAGTNTSISTATDASVTANNASLSNFTRTGSTSNFVAGFIPDITAAGNATSVLVGSTLQLSNGLTGGTWSSSNASLATINTTTGLVTGVATGSVTMTYTICSKTVSYNLTVIAPTITTTGTLKTFASCSGAVITPQSFTVAGTNLSANVTVNAPAGFEISTASGGTYTSTLALTPSAGTLSSTSVFVRLINSSTTASSGVISVTSTGAVSRTVTATVNTDNALNFDGINDYVTLPNESSFDFTNQVTVEAWIKVAAFNKDWQAIVTKGDDSWRLHRNSNTNFINFAYTNTSNGVDGVTSTIAVNDNKWHHVAGVYNGSSLSIYIDGTLNQSVNVSTTIKNSNNPVIIGNNFDPGLNVSNRYFTGSIDEVRIWNVARTSSQIQASYLTELAGNESGLVANYNFNQGIGGGDNQSISNLIDRSTNAINGTLTNFTKTGTASNFIAGFIPEITAAGNATTVLVGSTLQLSNGLTGGTWSSSNASLATVNVTTGLVTGVAAGSVSMTYTICSKTVSYDLNVITPTITTSGTLNAFSSCLGTASASQTFTVSAQYLTSNLVLTAPAGYELSTTAGGTYSSTLSLTPTSGTVSARLIYVRLSNSALNGQSGNIVITSTDAVTQNIATGNATVTRTVAASVSISSDATNNAICAGSNIVFTATPTNGGNSPSYQWKLNGNNITGANSATYSTTSLTNNDAISVSMTSSLSSCVTGSPASSNTITTIVTSIPSTPGAISGLTTICLNSNQVYSVPAVSGATSYTWVVTGNISATVSSTTNVINITAANTQGSGSLEVFANNACGTSAASSSLSITVNNTPAPTASFTVSPSTTVCLTSPSVTFSNTSTPNAGSTLTAYNWNFGDGSSQLATANASRTYTTSGNFDVVMNVTSSNNCTSSFSSRIVVDPISLAGSASVAKNTICEGTSTVLTIAGNTGAIQWQSSTDGNSFSNISGANSATYTTPNLTATTYYKAVVTSGSCTSASTGVITVTVSPTPSVTLASLANINNTATSFSLSYSTIIGGADEYSITAVAPNAMPNFVPISNYGLPVSPITVSIPASPAGVYNFNLVVKNGSLGCVSAAIPFTQTIFSAGSTVAVTGATTYTFNNTPQGPATNTKTGSTGAVTYSYAGTGSTTYGPSATAPTNVGTYEVIATLAADANYSGATSAPYAFTITAASSTITVTGATTYTFNGSAQGPATNTKTGSSGAVTYSYVGTGSTTYTASATAPTNVGTYQVIATLAADANYSGATSAPYAFTITAASSTITVTGATTYTFNGSAQGPATNTKTGSTGAVTYSYVGTGSTTYGPSATPPTNAGTYQVIATLAADANYNGATSAPYAFTITTASSTITVTGATTYTFNGSAQGPATNTKTGSTGAVTYSYVGTGSTTYGPSATPPTNAGAYQVIATLATDGTYNGATSTPYAFTINKLAPIITLADIVKTMGDPNFTIAATSTSDGSITYSIANANIATVLSNTVTLTGVGITTITVAQAETENYLAATTTATLTVKPAAPSATPGSFIIGNPSNPSNTTGLISPNPGATLNFYSVATGGTASSVQPLPAIVGVYTFYVSQTINGIEGPRVPYTVTILPSITVKSNTYIVGAINNPSNISSLVIGITNGSKPRWCNASGLNCTDVAPALPSTPGVYIWCVKAVDIATGLESSGCVYDTVTILAPATVMAVQKRASALTLQPDGTYTMDFTFTLTNNLSVTLDSIQLIDNLSAVFTSPSTYKVISVTASGTLVASTTFNGSSVTNLLLPASKLGANKSETVVLRLQVLPQTYAGTLTNNVTAFALSPYGTFGSPASTTFVIPAVSLFISDVITPNQDGKNDQWIIVKPSNKQLKVEIVNRWGQRVFANSDYQNNFVGRGTGSFLGQDLAEGTYFYFIEIVDRVTGVKEFRKGYLTLKR